MFEYPYPAKWWLVEVVFEKHLNARQLRRLGPIAGKWVYVYPEGIPLIEWPDKWPTRKAGRDALRELASIGVPFRWRAAPYGRDCQCVPECERGSNTHACHPEWVEDDWHTVDPGEVTA